MIITTLPKHLSKENEHNLTANKNQDDDLIAKKIEKLLARKYSSEITIKKPSDLIAILKKQDKLFLSNKDLTFAEYPFTPHYIFKTKKILDNQLLKVVLKFSPGIYISTKKNKKVSTIDIIATKTDNEDKKVKGKTADNVWHVLYDLDKRKQLYHKKPLMNHKTSAIKKTRFKKRYKKKPPRIIHRVLNKINNITAAKKTHLQQKDDEKNTIEPPSSSEPEFEESAHIAPKLLEWENKLKNEWAEKKSQSIVSDQHIEQLKSQEFLKEVSNNLSDLAPATINKHSHKSHAHHHKKSHNGHNHHKNKSTKNYADTTVPVREHTVPEITNNGKLESTSTPVAHASQENQSDIEPPSSSEPEIEKPTNEEILQDYGGKWCFQHHRATTGVIKLSTQEIVLSDGQVWSVNPTSTGDLEVTLAFPDGEKKITSKLIRVDPMTVEIQWSDPLLGVWESIGGTPDVTKSDDQDWSLSQNKTS